jgi:hypothetical protein
VTDFGIIPEGWRSKTLRDILSEIEADQRAEIDVLIDVSPQAPDGQRNGITARQFALGWELLGAMYEALDPDKAEDDLLISICKLTGTVPHGTTKSEVSCTVNLDAGTVLEPDVAFAAVLGKPENLFTPKESFTAPTTGNHTVKFLADTAGPVLAPAGTLTVIQTSIPGWNSVTNPLDAVAGSPADTNETLRARREAELSKAGSASVKAIRADVLAIEVDGVRQVQQCSVLENATDAWDFVQGLPPRSLEVVVYDVPTIDNDLIAQTIFDSAAGGISKVGALSGDAVDEDDGTVYPTKFSRPTESLIYMTYDLETNSSYAGDTAFKAYIAETLNARHNMGADVLWWTCMLASAFPGVTNVVSLFLGTSISPASSADIPISDRQLARFDTTRIVRT